MRRGFNEFVLQEETEGKGKGGGDRRDQDWFLPQGHRME